MSFEIPRARARRVIGVLAAALVAVSLVWGTAPLAHAAEAPSITKPADQAGTVGVAITPVTVTGERMHELKATGLPEGLELKQNSETEGVISGTPKKAESKEVTLEAENEGVKETTTFKWTVSEPEAAPAITEPAQQHSAVGAPVTLTIKGERMRELSAANLPEGLTLELLSETEAKVTGTPKKPESKVVKLTAKNKEGAEASVTFEWTVEPEGAATITKPADQAGIENVPATPLQITGANMATLSAEGLPPGLALERLSSSEGVISGTPTKPGSYAVTLKATNPEAKATEATFSWTIATVGPTASSTPSISPGVVFSAARATCRGAAWSGGTVTTQWLLDGAPIAGATAATYMPPRSADGHTLACSQTATGANKVSTTLTSPARLIHEQPPQPSWPISAAGLHCATAVCMQQGAGPGAVGQAYPQEGSWWGSQQVRCVSAPWTSAVGSSAQPAVRAFAEAHAVRISLQRITSAGAVTVAAQELTALGSARDLLDGSSSPFGGTIVAPFGASSFAAGELWSTRFPGAVGHPNWFAPGGGILAYGVTGAPGVARSFQLTYTLAPADLGARLRCVAGADDGPAGAPTTSTFASSEYAVSGSSACGPRRLGGASLPQPALVWDGEPACVAASSTLAALGSTSRDVAVKGARAAVALGCGQRHGCRGTLTLTAVVGHKRSTLAKAAARVGRGSLRAISLRLSGRGKRAVKAAGRGGLSASLQLVTRRHATRVASVRLVQLG